MNDVLAPLILFFGVLLFFGTAAYAGFVAAPWIPVWKKDIERILRLARIRDNELVYDLGSGDGRVISAMVNTTQARVIGYEVSMPLFLWSWVKLFALGQRKRGYVRFADFFRTDLSQADVIFCFLTPKAMQKLSEKFKRELRPGTRVISYAFFLPGWDVESVDKPDSRSTPIFSYVFAPTNKVLDPASSLGIE